MTDSPKSRPQAMLDDTWRRTQVGFSLFLDVMTPWLLELGGWIFGALIAFDLVMLGVVLTIGPVDGPVKIATAAFALAMPPTVVGFVLLRLVADMLKIRLQETATKAFQDAGFSLEEVAMPEPRQLERTMSTVTLAYTYSLMLVSVLLTVVGLTAALWHSAWWIAVVFLVVLVLSLGVLTLASSQLVGPGAKWRAAAGDVESPKKS